MRLTTIYRKLLDAHGPMHWWPARTRFEIIVGAVLTQNTSWKNVQKAISNLRREKVLTINKLSGLGESTLAALIKPAGYYNLKARRLLNAVHWWRDNHRNLKDMDTMEIRGKLLAVNGIGPETADSILLYALGRPVFVIDAYTRRILFRLDMGPWDGSYDELRAFFEKRLPSDVGLYNDFHAQLVNLGNNVCRVKPLCSLCPFNNVCPSRKRERN
ncbi:MAG: endonuclease III domain-containing protein [Deltaproteobacteria bacterium]|nr:endonuclease III domain-containing protein [Deltaproteobacteria bacterium]